MTFDDAPSIEDFILANTAVSSPSLVPEIRLHLADNDRPLYRAGEDELEQFGIGTPYWAFAWAGGQALARHILDTPSLVAGKTVLDFGAGSGITAIASVMAGAFDVIAADIDPVAGTAMALNREINDVWFEITSQDISGEIGDWDIVLVGDVFYEKDTVDQILPWLKALHRNGILVLFGDPGRFYLKDLGLEPIAIYAAETTGIMEDSDLRNARVWRFSEAVKG